MITGFMQNQREEVRILGDNSGAINGENGMHQQTFISEQQEDDDCDYVVRRLTETECELLQGYPRGWTNINPIPEKEYPYWQSVWDEWNDINGKKRKSKNQVLKWMRDPNSSSARYKALGNSIALPFWHWMFERMAKYIPEDATLCSLFDGIGGFPATWESIHGYGTTVTASEIEPFPIAVSTQHFGNTEVGRIGDFKEVMEKDGNQNQVS